MIAAASICATVHAESIEVEPTKPNIADCAPQTLLDVEKISQQIILVGELHGTNEIPSFTAGLVCSLLRIGKSVILALELDGDQQPSLNRYLDSKGSNLDRRELIKGYDWLGTCQKPSFS